MANKCENRLLSLLQAQEWHLDRLYGEYSRQFGSLFANYNGRLTATQKREFQRILQNFNDSLQSTFENQINRSIQISDLCNDEQAEKYLKGMEVKDSQMNKFLAHNPDAVKSFLARKAAGLTFSERVWKVTEMTEESIMNVLEEGIFNGRSAAEMASDLKQYLKEPNRRFRRIRNAEGKLVLSNPAKNFHPGQGVYRSSYQNALRVSRNEINIAYRDNDYERRKEMPFVMGQRVQLSAAHAQLCICDSLTGVYPKEFRFVGWHPNCLCFTTSILLPREKMKEYLAGGEIDKRHQIKTIPKKAVDYINTHAEKFKKSKNPPYFLRDNFKATSKGYEPKKTAQAV